MQQRSGLLRAVVWGFIAAECIVSNLSAQRLTIQHPDDPAARVEYFVQTPPTQGPWPTVVFVHGHQDGARPGGQQFVSWGVLDRFARRGYLAVSISQPGYGGSTGPADFCGPRTQHAVSAVIARLIADGYAVQGKIVIEGISRGALVAGLVAAGDPSIVGLVLISGLFDLPRFVAEAKTVQAKLVVASILAETGGKDDVLRARSVLGVASRITASVLILNGAQDDRTSPEQARRLAETLNAHRNKARVIVYPEYGHQIPVSERDAVIDPFIDTLLKPN